MTCQGSLAEGLSPLALAEKQRGVAAPMQGTGAAMPAVLVLPARTYGTDAPGLPAGDRSIRCQ